MKKVSYRAPFDVKGNLMHYPQVQMVKPEGSVWVEHFGYVPPLERVEPDWREVVPFYATMKLDGGVTSGRSAKYVRWTDFNGRSYPMFVTDIVGLITSGIRIEDNEVSGFWIVCKRGANYGIRFHGEEES